MLNLRTKEQDTELTRQSLAALNTMRIRFPGKTEEEADAVLDEVCVCGVCACYWVCRRGSVLSPEPTRRWLLLTITNLSTIATCLA